MSVFSAMVGRMDAACKSNFGEAVTYQPSPPFGEPVTITGIIESPNVEEETSTPTMLSLFVVLSDFSIAPVKGDQVTIGTKAYTVFDVSADLEGGARLALQEA